MGKKPESPRYICLPPLPINLASPQNPKVLWNIQLKALLWGIEFVAWAWEFLRQVLTPLGFPDGFSGKETACQYRRCGFEPWAGKIPPGGRNGNPHQYSYLKKIPWTEEPGRLHSPQGGKEWDATEHTCTH